MKGTARAIAPKLAAPSGRSVTLFVSYSHLNRVWMQRLNPILAGMQYDDRAKKLVGLAEVSTWHDNELRPGDQWDQEIRIALDNMNIFVPLVSAEFFASHYVMTVELPKAIERHGRGEIRVVPILLQDLNLREKCAFLNKHNPLPAWGKCWTQYRPYANAFRSIDDGLWDVIQTALTKSPKK